MPARFIIRNSAGPTRSVYLADGEAHDIGRDPECAVCVAHPSVSRRHARVHVVGDDWQIEDLGSKNGTRVDGEPFSGKRTVVAGTQIMVGDIYCAIGRPDRNSESQADQQMERSVAWRRRLSPALGTHGLVEASVNAILELSGFHRGFALLQDKSGAWRVFARSGIDTSELGSRDFSGSLSSVRACVNTRQPVVCHEVDPGSWLGERPSIIAGGIEALLVLPLAVGDKLLGVIYADRTEPGDSISELDLNILESLASHAALALAVSRMEEMMASVAGDLDERADWASGVDASESDTLSLSS